MNPYESPQGTPVPGFPHRRVRAVAILVMAYSVSQLTPAWVFWTGYFAVMCLTAYEVNTWFKNRG